MTRTRASAKQAGARFERSIADHLRDNLDDRIDRRVKTGANDCGDIGGIRTRGGDRVVLELKDYGGKQQPTAWLREAQIEAGNDDAAIGVVVSKLRGVAAPGRQLVSMTVDDLIYLLGGDRPCYDN